MSDLLLLKCPKCKHNMKYQGRGIITEKRKLCVYCNSSFKVKDSIMKKL